MAVERYKRYTKNDNAPGGFMEKGEVKKLLVRKMRKKMSDNLISKKVRAIDRKKAEAWNKYGEYVD